MGQSIACAARVDGKSDRGEALLETDEVIFRGGARRARVPFASIRAMTVEGAWLAITHASGSLELELGTKAGTWEGKIRSPKGFIEKLGVKAGARVALVGMAGRGDEKLAADLAQGGASVRAGAPRAEVDVILLRVKVEKELTRVKSLAGKLAADGALWVVRPKGKDGIAEGAVFDAGKGAGLVDVKVARFSETETAMKFVVPVAARKR